MRRHVISLLVLLNVALAFCLAAMWFDESGRLRGVHWQPPAPRGLDVAGIVPTLSPQVPANASQFAATLERPLFSPNRRPPVAAAAPSVAPPVAPPPADPLSKVRILGLYAGARSGGVIAEVDGKARRVSLNERIEDWTLVEINDQEREVTFRRNGETRVLSLAESRSSSKAGAASAAPNPAAAQSAAASAAQKAEQDRRARLARINELRARAGQRPISTTAP